MSTFWWKKWCPLFVFRHADLVLSVSNFTHQETINNAGADPERVRLLYHGFNAQEWQPVDGSVKEDMVLTVAYLKKENIHIKGLDLFVRTAAYLPSIPFFLVGEWEDQSIKILRAVAPPNVTFVRRVNREVLVQMYSVAKVYVQASLTEAFGCALAEAMLCDCMPVVSRRGALPEVVGDCGLYCDDLSRQGLAVQIRAALESPDCMGHKVRERIIQQFPLSKRRENLLALIEPFSTGKAT